MMQHTIITIGRQFGSGGHEVGNQLSERLNIPLYDHNLIRMAAQELRISNEDATKVDETGTRQIPVRLCCQQFGIPCLCYKR